GLPTAHLPAVVRRQQRLAPFGRGGHGQSFGAELDTLAADAREEDLDLQGPKVPQGSDGIGCRSVPAADSVQPIGTHEVHSWDMEADVVVVGAGCAGASAAIEAGRAGADVVVLERSGGPGGASAMSGGSLYLGGGTPIQKACGFEDTPDNMLAFVSAAAGPDADTAKVELY